MLWDAVGVVAALVILLIVGGFGVLVVCAVVVALAEEAIEFYRKHFGIEGQYMRTREMLDAEGRKYFDEAMERLHVEGVNEEPPDERV